MRHRGEPFAAGRRRYHLVTMAAYDSSPSEATMTFRFIAAVPCRTVVLLVLAALLVRPDAAMAQRKYEVTGFREARFGMTEPEVRASARNSFGAKDDEMTVVANASEGTTMLIVHVPALEFDLGEGRVCYIFGYRSQRLIQVNVIWGDDTNPPFNDLGMVPGALRLKAYFLGFGWRDRSVRNEVPIDANSLLLFAGDDDSRGAVRLVLEGVQYKAIVNGVIDYSPPPTTRPRLSIRYIADRYSPDIQGLLRRDF
jgi:hypothetical protein